MGSGWAEERRAFTRAIAGAYIFGLPLLFTMEMWWIGEYLSAKRLLLFVAIGLVANFGLARVAGFRKTSSVSMDIDQAIDAVAIGIIAGTIVLVALNQINLRDDPRAILGMILIQAVPLSIGASVARQVFGEDASRTGTSEGEANLSGWRGVASDIGATVIGGIFLGFSAAPTDEIQMIAAGLDLNHLLAVIAFTLVLGYIIVFASGFDEESPPGPFQHPITETALAYLTALVVALAMLVLFDKLSFADPPLQIIRQSAVLAVPVTVGGAAGRLVV